MKSLKFEHSAAKLVSKGLMTSTGRLYDDKDLSVNDEVRLVDQVDPARPETWTVIGTARIDTIIQKRLGDVVLEDGRGDGLSYSREEALKIYRGYYGSGVTYDTPIKVVSFTFNNSSQSKVENDDEKSTNLKEVKLYADGGSRGNPGPSASGYIMCNMRDNIVVKKGTYLGVTTNNQAEYQALKLGLEEAARMNVAVVHVYMDSLLVINQMTGVFSIKNRDLWPIHAATKDLAQQFAKVTYTHVPRELNKLADAAVNETLDQAASAQT